METKGTDATKEEGTDERSDFFRQVGGRFIYHSAVGSGTYGRVMRVVDRTDPTSKTLALKVQDRTSLDWIHFIREVETLAELQAHPNIVEVKDAGFGDTDPDCRWILMEYVRGDAARALHRWSLNMRIELARFVAYHVLSALQFMHSKRIAHRDVKPANILIDPMKDDYGVRLCDFGMSKNMNIHLLTGGICTAAYRAPEVYRFSKRPTPDNSATSVVERYSTKMDIWALGMSLLDIVLGHYYFFRGTEEDTVDAMGEVFGGDAFGVKTGKNPIGVQALIRKLGIDAEYQVCDLLASMLVTDPETRPDATTLLRHPLFAGMPPIELDPNRGFRPIAASRIDPALRSEYVSDEEYVKSALWMTYLGKKIKLRRSSLLLAFELLDFCLHASTERGTDGTKAMDLISYATLYLGNAYNEVECVTLEDLVYFGGGQFTAQELSRTIADTLRSTGFNLRRFLDAVRSVVIPEKNRYKDVLYWFLESRSLMDKMRDCTQ